MESQLKSPYTCHERLPPTEIVLRCGYGHEEVSRRLHCVHFLSCRLPPGRPTANAKWRPLRRQNRLCNFECGRAPKRCPGQNRNPTREGFSPHIRLRRYNKCHSDGCVRSDPTARNNDEYG